LPLVPPKALLLPPRPPVDDIAPPVAFDPPNATAPPLAEEPPLDPLAPPDPGAEECVVEQAASPASATIRESEPRTFGAGSETDLVENMQRILQLCPAVPPHSGQTEGEQ
jgi:hypothetical protein